MDLTGDDVALTPHRGSRLPIYTCLRMRQQLDKSIPPQTACVLSTCRYLIPPEQRGILVGVRYPVIVISHGPHRPGIRTPLDLAFRPAARPTVHRESICPNSTSNRSSTLFHPSRPRLRRRGTTRCRSHPTSLYANDGAAVIAAKITGVKSTARSPP